MNIEKHESSYIIEPYTILSYGCRKANGELPVIRMGKKCSIAANCTFLLANHTTDTFSTQGSHGTTYSKGDIVIQNDVWIGANCTILDGITIGNGAVIAAGAVVTKSVPPYAIVGGNPARIIRYRFSPELIADIEASKFWDMKIEEINKFDTCTKDIPELLRQVRLAHP